VFSYSYKRNIFSVVCYNLIVFSFLIEKTTYVYYRKKLKPTFIQTISIFELLLHVHTKNSIPN
jgi:hypothetical protein